MWDRGASSLALTYYVINPLEDSRQLEWKKKDLAFFVYISPKYNISRRLIKMERSFLN